MLDCKLYSVDELDKLPDHLKPENLTTITNENTTAFFSCHSRLSNHYPCQFEVDGRHYSSVEQCFMHKKATLFHDEETAHKIMSSDSPVEAKRLGKKVQNFKLDIWKQQRDSIMFSAVSAKFSQNDDLAQCLKKTDQNIIAEANPFDSYWGVGLALEDKNIWETGMWKGANRLGSSLTEVRDRLN